MLSCVLQLVGVEPSRSKKALFRYTTGANKAMLFLAAILGVVQGCTLPALLYLFGDSLDAFGDIDPADEINKIIPKLLVVGASDRNKQTPLATKNLLEDTDGLRRPP